MKNHVCVWSTRTCTVRLTSRVGIIQTVLKQGLCLPHTHTHAHTHTHSVLIRAVYTAMVVYLHPGASWSTWNKWYKEKRAFRSTLNKWNNEKEVFRSSLIDLFWNCLCHTNPRRWPCSKHLWTMDRHATIRYFVVYTVSKYTQCVRGSALSDLLWFSQPLRGPEGLDFQNQLIEPV